MRIFDVLPTGQWFGRQSQNYVSILDLQLAARYDLGESIALARSG